MKRAGISSGLRGAAMGRVLKMPTTSAQQALARFRREEDSFRTVLDVVAEWRNNELLVALFGIYRKRLRLLRLLYGRLLDGAEERTAADELQRFRSVRRATPKAPRITPKRDR
ncbi:MAG TPA: hypothetical protein VFK90_17950 [Anaeromyxobacter sp.]|nr:hypothetical protein [Anaeromyxobacter sp.]